MNMNKRTARDTILNAGLIASTLVVLLVGLVGGPAEEVAKPVPAVMVA